MPSVDVTRRFRLLCKQGRVVFYVDAQEPALERDSFLPVNIREPNYEPTQSMMARYKHQLPHLGVVGLIC